MTEERGDDGGDCHEGLVRDQGAGLDARERFGEVCVLCNGDPLGAGDGRDLFGHSALAGGDDDRGAAGGGGVSDGGSQLPPAPGGWRWKW
jgi:hypothetical protein